MPLFPPALGWRARATYVAHAGKAVFRQHHRELLPALRPMLAPDGIVLDIGAHAGQFAKLFAGMVPDGTVYAFEPSTYAGSILALAVRARRLHNVTVVAAALGDKPGEASLSTPVKAAGSVRFGLAHLGAGGSGRTEAVPVTTVDAFVAARSVPRVSFVKADVEGWEMRMLTGAAGTIRRFRPPMLIELIDGHLRRAGDTLESAWALLTASGYQAHTWSNGRLARCEAPRDGDCFWLPAG